MLRYFNISILPAHMLMANARAPQGDQSAVTSRVVADLEGQSARIYKIIVAASSDDSS